MPVENVGRAQPQTVKIVGDIGNLSIPGLSNEDLVDGMKGFAEMSPKKCAAEIREQSQLYTMLLQGGKLNDEETKLAKAALKETKSLARHIERTGELPAARYAELVLAVGWAAGKAFEDS